MWCAHCKEPLLLADREIQVPLVRYDDMPMPYLTGKTVNMTLGEYRSSKAGPGSRVLTFCPGCGVLLSSQTVQEIVENQYRC